MGGRVGRGWVVGGSWVGGWVMGGWMGDGWVGGWVGGWLVGGWVRCLGGVRGGYEEAFAGVWAASPCSPPGPPHPHHLTCAAYMMLLTASIMSRGSSYGRGGVGGYIHD